MIDDMDKIRIGANGDYLICDRRDGGKENIISMYNLYDIKTSTITLNPAAACDLGCWLLRIPPDEEFVRRQRDEWDKFNKRKRT